ncbi:bifunctional hydroxymethylpyrimidine kinase/phosphomethylpyrimidine kinase [Candidatus Erwinia haradaeae]|uniref:hydroxymethylpyrimidine kinase n=1 Tax=Candidatus Erwinia haradaeae TaxID=1922217 RepID=A0A451DKU4_9GAMM|nr:bifunctional hydroxymethylpyrimidine kinase/phosphomethylpyrimidine kinase [Candidatus Erwinia haradaeae]VFP87341.1 Hydroxymethylpyrimidine/phosphomethylpyrimidine kinase [Candidatus Erwinia haradaeae]
MTNEIYNVLSIAGTDPSGGAGIQADLKTFSALGVYGATVITAIVAQNTQGVQSIYSVSDQCVAAQLDSVLSDLHINSIKIGMLHQAKIIRVVAKKLIEYPIPWVVLDTVMIAKNGDTLLDKDAIILLREILLPLVSIITPNLLEAAILLGCNIAKNETQMRQQGRKLLELGCEAVVIKGGHLTGLSSPDWLITANKEWCFRTPRVKTLHTHGTGCTLSAALAARQPFYKNWSQTLKFSKEWIQKALIHGNGLSIGKGTGPVHHFYEWW